MYFASRVQAGRMLAEQIAPKYRYEDCVVVALNDGGVIVGAQIAMKLHCAINMILTEDINIPMEPQAISGIAHDGSYTYNSYYERAVADELSGEYFNYIEQQKSEKMHSMQQLLGSGGVTRKDMLRGHRIILVSDGLRSPFSLELAVEFLKPIRFESLIVATPMASIQAVDRMHVLADDLYCLNVLDSELPTDHYYEANDIPDHQRVVEIIEKIILNWK